MRIGTSPARPLTMPRPHRGHGGAGPARRLERRGAALLACCLLAALAPEGARAQGGFLIFQAGSYVPTQDLGVLTDAGFGEAVEFGERERSFAYSLGLELAVSGPFSGRATLAYGTSADVVVEEGMCPECEASNNVLNATAALVFRPLPDGLAIQPYLLGGGGVKHYDLQSLDALNRSPLQDQTRRTLLLGAGIEIRLGPMRVVTELSDYVSPIFADNDVEATQHDLFLTAGLMLGSG